MHVGIGYKRLTGSFMFELSLISCYHLNKIHFPALHMVVNTFYKFCIFFHSDFSGFQLELFGKGGVNNDRNESVLL